VAEASWTAVPQHERTHVTSNIRVRTGTDKPCSVGDVRGTNVWCQLDDFDGGCVGRVAWWRLAGKV
jgi:hypothetical protein